jgi:uncharacterized protein YqeY
MSHQNRSGKNSSNPEASLKVRVETDLRQAMRDQDDIAKLALRSLKTAMTEASVAGAAHELSEAEAVAVVQREAKRRRDTAAEYTRLGAEDRARQELAELAVLERYLPQQMSEAEVETLARAVIAETGATSMRDVGRIMPPLIAKLEGRADGRLANQVVRRLLGG